MPLPVLPGVKGGGAQSGSASRFYQPASSPFQGHGQALQTGWPVILCWLLRKKQQASALHLEQFNF